MKVRYLKDLLGTSYDVHIRDGKLCFGSNLCGDLISLDPKSMKLRYALAVHWGGEHRSQINHQPLLDIWDGVTRLVESGEIREILEGDDDYPDGVPVFFERDGEICESVTDVVEWKHTTREGVMIYENTHFPTRELAIRSAIRHYELCLENRLESIVEAREKVARIESDIAAFSERLERFRSEAMPAPQPGAGSEGGAT